MKKIFPLNDVLSSNNNKKYKGKIEIKNIEKGRNKIKSPFPLRRNKNSESKNKMKQKYFRKTPGKKEEKTSINKIIEITNECNKTNSSPAFSIKNNHLFLLSCLLGNNKNYTDQIKDYKKYLNKLHTNLLNSKKQNIQLKKEEKKININIINNNQNLVDINPKKEKSNQTDINNKKNKNISNNNNKKEKIENKNYKKQDGLDINKIEDYNLNEICTKSNKNNINNNEEIKSVINKNKIINKDKNPNIITKEDNNNSNDEINVIQSYNNLKISNSNSQNNGNLKILVNTSNNLKDADKSNKNNKKLNANKSVKTPKNIFKQKVINMVNNSLDNNKLNKSDNTPSLNNKNNENNIILTKKKFVKSNSVEKYLKTKNMKLNNFTFSKNLFKLNKDKKNNPSNKFLMLPNNTNSNKYINNKKGRKEAKENKSCDTFFHKENSLDFGKININIINDNNIEEKNKKDNNSINNKNKKIKKNFFKNLKGKKLIKHKSQDFNSKNALTALIMSQNDMSNFIQKKENKTKTPEKVPKKLIKSFQKEINNNIHVIKQNNNTNDKKEKEKEKEIFLYNILPGNNGKLIEKCLLNRNQWEMAKEEKKNLCNFIWTPLSCQINYSLHSSIEKAQVVNHFEYHCELTNKSKTFINLFRYCEFNEINLFSFYPLTIIITFNTNTFNSQIENFKRLYNDIPNLVYNDKEKDNNKNDLNKYYIDYFNVNLSKKIGSVQKIKIPKTHYNGKNMWLLKRDNLNRGRKIKVLSNLEDIIKEINTLYEQKSPNNLLIQKYIEQPLLYNKRKFDIRIWVLFTFIKIENKYEVYVFKEGHLKACSDEFNIDSDDLFIHLTNYSVQKHNKNFSKTEVGNEISFNDFQKELNEKSNKENEGKNNQIDFRKDIFPEIIKIIALSANSVKGKINLTNRGNCFEIFGYDFILDINYRPFLLEINTNPGYEESSPLIKMLVPRMIDDALKLTVDKEFESAYITNDNLEENNKISKSNYEVEGYSSEENMWLKIKTKL